MTQNTSTKLILLTYLSTLALFIGSGFVSGAIVHTGDISELYKYLVIGIVGIGLFIVGSFIQEALLNAKNLKDEGVVKFFLSSLILAVGIGMISGGTQHFSDFPIYASYLIPLGLIVSYVAFLLKNSFKFTRDLIIIGFILTGIAAGGFFSLNTYAKNSVEQAAKTRADLCNKAASNPTAHGEINTGDHHGNDVPCPTINHQLMTNGTIAAHDMSSVITNNQNFIENMTPHHMEAINTSYIVQATTLDPELKQFASSVITNQSKEVLEMKNSYKQLFNKDYVDNTSYAPMMTKMNGLGGSALDRAYIEGMVAHHTGAVQMAQKMLTIKDIKPELLTLSNNIIKDQIKEIEILNGWLMSKFIQSQPSSPSTTKIDSDGHTGH